MKKFIIQLSAVFLFLVTAFILITVITDRGLRKTRYENFGEWNDIFGQKIHPDILIHGSSRAWVQYNTAIIDSVLSVDSYNMGMDGTPFDGQFLRFKACLTCGIIPKMIIQNVDWETIKRSTPPYQAYQLLPYLHHLEFGKDIIEMDMLSPYDVYVPFVKYSGHLKAIGVGWIEAFGIKHLDSGKHKGYKGTDSRWDGSNFEQLKRKKMRTFEPDKEVEKMFFEFLITCKKLNIEVVLVYSPPYYKLNDYMDTDKITSYYHTIAEKYHIRFLDFSKDAVSLDINNYYNATHLNRTGSAKFTQALVESLK